jgi:hypothetical protein
MSDIIGLIEPCDTMSGKDNKIDAINTRKYKKPLHDNQVKQKQINHPSKNIVSAFAGQNV